MTLLLSRIILTIALLYGLTLIWTKNVNLILWAKNKIVEILPISENEENNSSILSKVASANFTPDGNLIIQILIANKSKVDIQLTGTNVYLINLLEFKTQGKITAVKESRIDYEKVLLPPLSESKYDFSITKDAFEKIKSGELAILSKTTYSDNSNSKQILCIVVHYGKINNVLATYKLWHEKNNLQQSNPLLRSFGASEMQAADVNRRLIESPAVHAADFCVMCKKII